MKNKSFCRFSICCFDYVYLSAYQNSNV